MPIWKFLVISTKNVRFLKHTKLHLKKLQLCSFLIFIFIFSPKADLQRERRQTERERKRKRDTCKENCFPNVRRFLWVSHMRDLDPWIGRGVVRPCTSIHMGCQHNTPCHHSQCHALFTVQIYHFRYVWKDSQTPGLTIHFIHFAVQISYHLPNIKWSGFMHT